MNWEGYEVDGQMDISEFLDKGENMTENEAKTLLAQVKENTLILKEVSTGLEMLEKNIYITKDELEQYRAIGTVEELKAIRQWKADVMEDFCKYDASSFEEIVVNARAKAIDEFRAKANKEIHMCFSDDLEIQKHIDEVAEQMKAGGK